MDRFVNKKIEKQTIYEIYRACRLCGAGGGYKMPIIQNVVNLDNCDVELKQKIRECVQIEVHQNDKMPPLICELCVDKVNDFYEFLEMCRQTNKRTRLKLGLPPQMLPRGAPDAGDCILGVTEPIFVNEDDDEPLSVKKKVKTSKPKKEPEKKWKELRVKMEPSAERPRRQRAVSPPRPRRAVRASSGDAVLSTLQSKVKKAPSPPPKSILKKTVHKKPEASRQSSSSRLKRSREVEVKQEARAKRVKISLKSLPSRSSKKSSRSASPRRARAEALKVAEMEAQKKKQVPCPVCGVMFQKMQGMLSHKKSHKDGDVNTNTKQTERGKSVPNVKCEHCLRSFSTQSQMEGHSCGAAARATCKCLKCGKNFATRKSLNGHARACKKGEVIVDPEVRARLRRAQVRVAKCDALLTAQRDHCDVSGVSPNFGLDKKCVYPYMSSRLRIKTEPSDCMVKINDMDFGSYVHWDSDYDSGESDADHLDGLEFTVFTKKRRVESLAACSLKTIFSSNFLGKVPRKFRRVKTETIVNSVLNDSLSDLNINDDESASPNNDSAGSDIVQDSVKRDADKVDDDLFPKVNSDDRVTNEYFDRLFNDNKSDNGLNNAVVSDKFESIADKDSDVSEKNQDSGDLTSVVKENLDKENSYSNNVISSDKGNIEKSNEITNKNVKEQYPNPENAQSPEIQSNTKISDCHQQMILKTDLSSDAEKVVFEKHKTEFNDTNVATLPDNKNLNNFAVCPEDSEQEAIKSSEKLSDNCDDDTDSSTKNKSLETTRILHAENVRESLINNEHIEHSMKQNESDAINTSETSVADTNKNSRGSSEKKYKNKSEIDVTEHGEDKDFDTNIAVNGSGKDQPQINGDADIDDVNLNVNDLEDFSDAEFDDCKLMAEIDAQIGEKKRDEHDKDTEIDQQDTVKNIDIVKKDRDMDEKENETFRTEVSPAPKEQNNINENDTHCNQSKITLEDLVPQDDKKSMDLDSISDDEFDFND